MATIERRTFRGLNLRESELTLNPEYARDLQNVELNSKREVIKRGGFALDADVNSQALDYLFHKRQNEELVMTPTGPRNKVAGAWTSIGRGFQAAPTPYTEAVSAGEYNGVLYFADPSGANEIMKYDGKMWYRAGVPKVNVTNTQKIGGGSSQAGTYYYRVALFFRDSQGNIIWGDYHQLGPITLAANEDVRITIDTLKDTEFYSKFGTLDGAYDLGVAALDTIGVTSHNYLPGDYALIPTLDIPTGTIRSYRILKVLNVTANTIQFDITPLTTNNEHTPYGLNDMVEFDRWNVVVFWSDQADFGYQFNGTYNPVSNASATYTPFNDFVFGFAGDPMEDIYDPTVLKGLPPKGKYITLFNNVMVVGNIPSEDTSQGSVVEYLEDRIAFSDLGIGSTVETFGPLDVEKIGKTSEGPISGLFSDSEQVGVLKTNAVYFINGVLTTRNYRISRSPLEGIGCVSHKSIAEVEGGFVFASDRGLYITIGGSRPEEFTDMIQDLFDKDTTGLDLSKSRSFIDYVGEKYYCFIPATDSADDILLMYDYYHKEWFKHKGISARGGMILLDGVMKFLANKAAPAFSATYSRTATYSDDGLAIDAFYVPGWESGGQQWSNKKWNSVYVYSIGALLWDMTLKSYKGWDSTEITNQVKSFTATNRTRKQVLNASLSPAIQLKFQNNTLNQGMLISGFDIEVEPVQMRAKDEV